MRKIILTLIILSVGLYAKIHNIVVAIEPQKYIIEKIGKNRVNVKTFFQGSDLKKSHLSIKKAAKYGSFLEIGLDVEKNIKVELKKVNADMQFFDMSKDIKKISKNKSENPYIWTDPLKIREIARNVFLFLSYNDPQNRMFYKKNYLDFIEELEEIYLKTKQMFSQSIFSVYTFEHCWDYFLNRYDFPSYVIEKSMLKKNRLSDFIHSTNKKNARVLILDKKTPLNISQTLTNRTKLRVIHTDMFGYYFIKDLFILSKAMIKK